MKLIVTGAGKGLGLEIVGEALRRGHEVAAGMRSLETNVDALKARQEGVPGKLTLLELDVDEEDSIAKAKEAMADRWGTVDALINNAGILLARDQSIERLEFAAVENTFRTNLYGPMKMVKHFLPLLKESDRPFILNVSSEAGCFAGAYGGDYPYALSKAALNYFTAQLRKELVPQGFGVYAMHPGWIRTPMGGSQAPGDPLDSAKAILDLAEGKLKADTDAVMIGIDGKAMPQ
ncbi:SDR family NAD(P)-dependent oxidoreductase [Paenibacillus barengoltzii]|uniref:NAD(P)-dependent dehydrogenase, short-chain alcohol dehydrogenase family n=1 Tax=Paenibacillus barengoltzii J12 TaxID=935846 RepID=A0ABY1LV04_9BACL|nr:SDR family NAD(P)-dependent oxidoreductase [Paenibacillus barengoltzii]SMF09847.1 NAD(P)-dependent dehydrogenase, short-chain alcohol dehydrogenase family [Paenibacillus barengoltzii J12]